MLSVKSISRIVLFILYFLKLFQYDPVVTPGNEKIVHHVVLYRCRGEEPKYAHMDYDCYATTTDYRPECRSVFLMYEIGAGVGSSYGGSKIHFAAVLKYHSKYAINSSDRVILFILLVLL